MTDRQSARGRKADERNREYNEYLREKEDRERQRAIDRRGYATPPLPPAAVPILPSPRARLPPRPGVLYSLAVLVLTLSSRSSRSRLSVIRRFCFVRVLD